MNVCRRPDTVCVGAPLLLLCVVVEKTFYYFVVDWKKVAKKYAKQRIHSIKAVVVSFEKAKKQRGKGIFCWVFLTFLLLFIRLPWFEVC
jgi:hypothetical protein